MVQPIRQPWWRYLNWGSGPCMPMAVPPLQDAGRAEGDPPARRVKRLELKVRVAVPPAVQEPSAVGLSSRAYEVDGLGQAVVAGRAGRLEVVERAEGVVPPRRKGEANEVSINDRAGAV